MGLPSFQPLKLKHFKIDRSDSEINMDEVSLTGFQTCQLRSVHYTNNSKIFQTSIMIKHLVIEGSGYISGKLSILELGNQGHMRMNIGKIFSKSYVKLEHYWILWVIQFEHTFNKF